MKRLIFSVIAALTLHAATVCAVGTQPERILLTWDSDPAHSQAVSWRTEQPVAIAYGQITPAQRGPNLDAAATSVTARSELVETTPGLTVQYHTLSFRDLAPSKKYAYRVGDGTVWSEWNHFTTTSDKPEPFSFLYVGDAQNDVLSLWSRVIRDAFRHGSQAKFIVHAGDLINFANRDNEWGEWFEAAGWINRVVPSIAIPGNHEYHLPGPRQARVLSKFWRPQFEYPKNGPEGLDDTAYYLDVQGVRIVALNSNEKYPEQGEWLDRVLSDNPNRWTILTFHHPVYAGAAYRDSPWVRENWMPVIDRYNVDLVLQGHDHTYARSQKVTSGTVVGTTEHGAVYVVSISGSKMYSSTTATATLMARLGEDTQLYQLITVDRDRLLYEAHTVAGELYDAFELHKRANGKGSELVNKIPALPEHRRIPRNRNAETSGTRKQSSTSGTATQ